MFWQATILRGSLWRCFHVTPSTKNSKAVCDRFAGMIFSILPTISAPWEGVDHPGSMQHLTVALFA